MSFQKAIQFWKEFDVAALQKHLDEEASGIASRQDASETSLKKLVESNKEFKRTVSEELRKKASPLLRAFQSEVDALTKRSKAAETAFLSAYRKLIEVPDPVPIFEQALVVQQKLMSAQDLDIENKQLRDTLNEYNKEFAQVKNQEATINKLRSQIRDLESSAEDRATAAVAERMEKLNETLREREEEMKNLLSLAEAKKDEALARDGVLQAALESTQSELFELKNRFDIEAAAKAAEIDILVTDLERANQRATIAEKSLDSLQRSRAVHATSQQSTSANAELELEIQAKDKEITRLLDDVQRLQNSLGQLRETSSHQVSLLEEQLKEKVSLTAQLEERLNQQQDYEEVKKELSIMKTIEFSSSSQQQEGQTLLVGSGKPLEVLLLEKNRALVNENTSLKTELAELRGHFSSLQSQYAEAQQVLLDQKTLISHLEADLARVRPFLPPRTEGEGQANPSDIMAEAVKDVAPEHRGSSSSGGTTESLLSIVTNQRERFKQRNTELEAECVQQRQSASVLQREVDTLRGDNVKLYEKIRFLQSYQGTRRVGEDTTLNRYSSQYEASLDPFSAFSAKERQRKYMQLSGPDKATLTLGRFILSNKVARMAAFIYTLALHLIIIVILMMLVSCSDSQTVDLYTECAMKLTEHMKIFHAQEALNAAAHLHATGVGG